MLMSSVFAPGHSYRAQLANKLPPLLRRCVCLQTVYVLSAVHSPQWPTICTTKHLRPSEARKSRVHRASPGPGTTGGPSVQRGCGYYTGRQN